MSNTGTFDQALHALTLLSHQGLCAEQLNKLYGGYLSDLALALKNGSLPARDEFRRLLRLPPIIAGESGLVTEINFDMSLKDMISRADFDGKFPCITEELFPIEGTGVKLFRNKMFLFDRDYKKPEYVIAAMKKEGFVPGNHVHGIAFGAVYPDHQRRYTILCLGSSVCLADGPTISQEVLALGSHEGRRMLFTHSLSTHSEYYRYLGVQQISGA